MKKLLILSSLIFMALPMSSKTLDECRQLARDNYPEIQQYNLISQAEQYNLSNAATVWLPQVSVMGQITYQSAAPSYPKSLSAMMEANGIDMSGIRKDQYKISVDVSQRIWDGGKSKADVEILQADAQEQQSRVDVSLYGLQSKVDDLYFGMLLLEERAELTKAHIELLESNLTRMRVYHKNGVALQADVDAIEAEVITAQQTLDQINSSHDCYKQMLELFIGQPLTVSRLQRPEMQELTSRTSERPELALFDAQSKKLEAQRKSIETSIMPQLSAFAQAYYGYPGLDMFKSMTSSQWTLNGLIGLRVSWNIGALYTKKNNLSKLNIAQQQIDVQRETFLFNNQLQTTRDDAEIVRLRKALDDDNRIIELRSSVRKAAESKLKHGVIDATDLLRKINDETIAVLNRTTHEIELLQAIYRLKTTLNQ